VNDGLKIAVFASGKGSNFEAILKAIRTGAIRNAGIAVVISNNSGAGALEIARENEIAALHISRSQFESDDPPWANNALRPPRFLPLDPIGLHRHVPPNPGAT